MSIVRFTPIQDTFLHSGSQVNCGLDEILEIGASMYENSVGVSRTLLQFDSSKVQAAISGSQTYRATLHLYLSDAEGLRPNTVLGCHNVTETWEEGTGRFHEEPPVIDGATWTIRSLPSSSWSTAGGTTGSLHVSSSIGKVATDINLDVTSMVQGNCTNFLLKLENEQQETTLQYFSSDTNTIYRPYLEIAKDDSVYSSSLDVVTTSAVSVVPKNFKKEYRYTDKIVAELNITPYYPCRCYSTESLYAPNFILPENSYWGIKDEFTNEMVIDFDELSTKISANNSGSFFKLDMSLLEPEKYYRLLILTEVGDSEIVIDSRNIFKVVRNGSRE